MPRPADFARMLNCNVNDAELRAIATMKLRIGKGYLSDGNLIRMALWSLADELRVLTAPGVFDLRHGQGQYARLRTPAKGAIGRARKGSRCR